MFDYLVYLLACIGGYVTIHNLFKFLRNSITFLKTLKKAKSTKYFKEIRIKE